MIIFPKIRASYLYGQALMQFHQKRYNESARLLEKVCRLDKKNKQRELFFMYLGRSYLALGRNDEALNWLSNAYEIFKGKFQSSNIDLEIKEYMELLCAFRDVLEKVGHEDRANEVDNDIKRLEEESRNFKKQM